MTETIKILTELEASSFYGDVVLKFENGKIVIILKTEKIKPGQK